MYYWAGISAEDFKKELEYQLQKTTIGISIGLVKETNEEDEQYHVLNPYLHFGGKTGRELQIESSKRFSRSIDDNIRYGDVFRYKICEIRPPSLEKVFSFSLLLFFRENSYECNIAIK